MSSLRLRCATSTARLALLAVVGLVLLVLLHGCDDGPVETVETDDGGAAGAPDDDASGGEAPAHDDASPSPTASPEAPVAEEDSAPSGYTYESAVAGTVEIPEGFPTPETTGLTLSGADPGDLPDYDGPRSISETRVIEGAVISEALTVEEGGSLTIRDSHIEGNHPHFMVQTSGGELRIERSSVRPLAPGARAVRGSRVTIVDSDIRGGSTVLNLGSNSRLSGSFVADPGLVEDPGGHHDAVQTNGAEGLRVEGSTIIGRWGAQTSALFLQGNKRWDGLRDVHVEGNFLSGGNYTLYLFAQDGQDAVTGAVVRDNVWNDASWQYGPLSRSNVADDLVWEGNVTTAGEPVR